MNLTVFLAFILVLFGLFVGLQIWLVRRWQGGWRWAALLPSGALLVVIGLIVIHTNINPTSHNLWPFEILLWTFGGIVYLGLLALIRKIRRHFA